MMISLLGETNEEGRQEKKASIVNGLKLSYHSFAKKYKSEVLIIWGDQDNIFLIDMAKEHKKYQANPNESHLVAVKRIFRYLKRTSSLGLWYPKGSGFDLKGYSDSDYAWCCLDRKSTSGSYQILGGKLVCWSAKKQNTVAMSSAKVEYVVGAGVVLKDHILKGDIELHFIPIEYQLVDIFTKPLAEPSFTRLVAEL
ncbi:hypothetical protein Tco_1469050, partial [Tanacetum coccineum]